MTNPEPLTAAQLVEYQRNLSDNLTGAEQSALRERDPAAYEEAYS